MSQAPSMPLYTDALLGDTLHLSAEEFGAYCLLLFATWRNNGRALPDDDRKLARICRVSIWKWKQSLRAQLLPFFNTDDGAWHQKRLEKEWDFVAKRREVFAKKGTQGGHAKALKTNKRPLAHALAPNPIPINTPSECLYAPSAHTARDARARPAAAGQKKLSPIEGIFRGFADAADAIEARNGGADQPSAGALLDDPGAGSVAAFYRRGLA